MGMQPRKRMTISQDDYDKVVAEKDALQKERDTLQKDLDTAKKDKDALQKERDAIQKDLESARKTTAADAKVIEDLRKRVDDLKLKLGAASAVPSTPGANAPSGVSVVATVNPNRPVFNPSPLVQNQAAAKAQAWAAAGYPPFVIYKKKVGFYLEYTCLDGTVEYIEIGPDDVSPEVLREAVVGYIEGGEFNQAPARDEELLKCIVLIAGGGAASNPW